MEDGHLKRLEMDRFGSAKKSNAAAAAANPRRRRQRGIATGRRPSPERVEVTGGGRSDPYTRER